MRDAYHSEPSATRVKLEGLESLKLDALASLPAFETTESTWRLPPTWTPRATRGVRLAERLRHTIRALGGEESTQTRRRVVVDLLFSVAPPAEQRWARHAEPLVADVAGLLGLSLSTSDLNKMVRGHRAAQRAMWHTARHVGFASPVRTMGDPHEALGDALAAAMCVRPEVGLPAAITLMRGDEERTSPDSIAGGVLLDRLDTGDGPAIDTYVGTAVARTNLPALVHHLATLECIAADDPEARVAVQGQLRQLRSDILTAQTRDEQEKLMLTAAARLVEAARDRLDQRSRPRLGGFRPGPLRQNSPQPGYRA